MNICNSQNLNGFPPSKKLDTNPLDPSGKLKFTSFAMPVIKGAIADAIYRSPIIIGIAIITALNTFPFVDKTTIEAITAKFAKSPNGKTVFPGKTNARRTAIGVNNKAVEIIAGLPTATAISSPIYKSSLSGYRSFKNFLIASDKAIILPSKYAPYEAK